MECQPFRDDPRQRHGRAARRGHDVRRLANQRLDVRTGLPPEKKQMERAFLTARRVVSEPIRS